MLLEFRVKNYKSFREELVFSMKPVKRQKDLLYSLLSKTIDGKPYWGLSTAVIYGANASGKTNIIGAMDTFKNIILRGNIKDCDATSPDAASFKLALIPNNALKRPQATSFSLEFIADDFLIKYQLSINLGTFLDTQFPREIINERLYINNDLIFSRDNKKGVFINCSPTIKNHFEDTLTDGFDALIPLINKNLNKEELFLTNGFKSVYSATVSALVTDWIDDQFLVFYRSDLVKTSVAPHDMKKNSVYVGITMNKVAKCFGIGSNGIGYIQDEDSDEPALCSFFEDENENGKGRAVPADTFESLGTMRFMYLFPIIKSALLNGSTLIVDELDASIHPMAIMNLITIFHNDEININHAQLIFNTHNPIYLNKNLFRRDEIKFVERDEETHTSTHYSLSDFGTSGENGVRSGEDYLRNYFIDRYGAIRSIDFSSFLRPDSVSDEEEDSLSDEET